MNQHYVNTLKPLSVLDLALMKKNNEKIAALTTYDASFCVLLDEEGVDILLVGDSLGMVIQGHGSTLPTTLDNIIYHASCVSRVRQRGFIIADLPFISCSNLQVAMLAARRLLAESGAQMVKLEGARIDIITNLVEQGIPVCGHLGLLPQSINQLGRYQVQGRDSDAASKIFADACNIEQAGASVLILECVPPALAHTISKKLSIPVIGIGAGMYCDGQILVLYDILNIGVSQRPKFSKDFLLESGSIATAIRLYVEQVKAQQFPRPEHCY